MPIPVFPTLSKNPSFPLAGSSSDPAMRFDVENGPSIGCSRSTKGKRTFPPVYPELPYADLEDLRDFYEDTVRGGSLNFSWTNPDPDDGSTYTVYFSGPLNYSLVKPGYYQVSFSIKEV
jgi:hypothetical protein